MRSSSERRLFFSLSGQADHTRQINFDSELLPIHSQQFAWGRPGTNNDSRNCLRFRGPSQAITPRDLEYRGTLELSEHNTR
jgi:hypothetical protein